MRMLGGSARGRFALMHASGAAGQLDTLELDRYGCADGVGGKSVE